MNQIEYLRHHRFTAVVFEHVLHHDKRHHLALGFLGVDIRDLALPVQHSAALHGLVIAKLLLAVLERPFDEQPGNDADSGFPPEWAASLEVSCSS